MSPEPISKYVNCNLFRDAEVGFRTSAVFLVISIFILNHSCMHEDKRSKMYVIGRVFKSRKSLPVKTFDNYGKVNRKEYKSDTISTKKLNITN